MGGCSKSSCGSTKEVKEAKPKKEPRICHVCGSEVPGVPKDPTAMVDKTNYLELLDKGYVLEFVTDCPKCHAEINWFEPKKKKVLV